MANDSEERDRATEIMRAGFSPAERGVDRRGLSMTPETRLNPERVRRGQEEARLHLSRVLTVERFRSLTEVRTPIPLSQRAVVGRFVGEATQLSRHVLPFLSPGADIIVSLLEDLHTAITGEIIDYSQLESVEATPLDRALAVVNIALTLIPEAGPVLRQGGRVARMARQLRRSADEVEGMLRALDRFAGRRETIQLAVVKLRLGQRPTAQQSRALNEFVEELTTLESRRVREVADARGTAGRATHRSAETPREGRTGSRSSHRGRRAERTPRGGRRAEARPRGRRARRSVRRAGRPIPATVLDVLRESGVQATKIADVRVGGSVEPIFETSKGWIVGSYDALQKYKTMNPMYFRWEAHHIIEVRHLELFPELMSGWTRGSLPNVLLNKPVHGDIAGELSRLLPEPLPRRPVGQTQVELVFDAYEEVYGFVRNGAELLDIVETMLRL